MLTIQDLECAATCEDIFVNNENQTKKIYREFAKKYHPDVYKEQDMTVLFSKLNDLYEKALEKISKGIWEEKDVLLLECANGKKYKLKYLCESDFELGKCYVSRNHLIYIIQESKKKFFDNALKVITDLRFADSEMEKEFKRYLPNIENHYQLKDGSYCLVISKTDDIFPLSNLLEYYKNKGELLDPKHCAWVISRLNNLVCFLEFNDLVHNGLSIDNLFVSPKFHTICLYGGWWYSVPKGEKMIGTQKVIFDLMPVKEKADKIATFKTDIECVRAIGRSLNKNVPKPMLDWLEKGSSDNAFKEFESWNKVLTDSFGERKFVVLDISEKDIYHKI